MELNIRCFNPSAHGSGRWKIHELMGYLENQRLKGHLYPFIAFTETWLKSYHHDAQLTIPGYSLCRNDRSNRKGGGVLLYTLDSIPVTSYKSYDDGICQAITCVFASSKTFISVVYRPPDASTGSFGKVLQFLDKMWESDYDTFLIGDFNFPIIDWGTLVVIPDGSSETSRSAEMMLDFMEDYHLNQQILLPTRGNITLDLLFTNNGRLVCHVSSEETSLSDHNLVDVVLLYNPTIKSVPSANSANENEFRCLYFRHADFDKLNDRLWAIKWDQLRSSCSFNDFPAVLTNKIFSEYSVVIPLKKPPAGHPKCDNTLRRRKAKLKTHLSAAKVGGDCSQIRALEDQIASVCFDIKEAIVQHLDFRENTAVQKIKSNPKFFFSYAKSFSKVKTNISILLGKDNETLTS